MTRGSSGLPHRPGIIGTGDPTVVLPDCRGERDEWRRALTGLAGSLSVLLVEPPAFQEAGTPGSGPQTGPTAEEELGGILVGLDHWPAHLVGVGRGGGLALEVARQRPELVRGLVLHEPVGPWGSKPGDSPGEAPEAGGAGVRPGPSRPEAEGGVREDVARGDLEHPILVTAGSESPWPLRRAARRLAGRLPNARWLLLPGVAGRPHQESPDLFVAVVTEFLTVRSVPPS